MAHRIGAWWLVLCLIAVPDAASAACKISRYVDIPVTMVGARPVVTAQINGRDARFILDSGAFFSTISAANAQEYGLKIESLGDARLRGIGGETSLRVTTVKELRLADVPIPKIEFGVGGSDTGFAGLLGQNILGLADAEYDLPHGFVRLMKSEDCHDGQLAYWAGTKPFTVVPILPMNRGQRHTIGTIMIDGKKIKAMFDTGAESSMLTLEAAKRLGKVPGSTEVESSGFAYGLGTKRVRSWRTRFATIDIGGETISKPWVKIADYTLDGPDMLIGVDFFRTHRIYVDNRNHRMFITYEGGPLFGLDPKGAVDETGARLDLTDKTGEPTDAAGYSRRGGVFASNGKLEAALADFDKAVMMAPGEARYVLQRGEAHLRNRQILLGAADVDKAIELAPRDGEARMVRAQLRLSTRDPAGALSDLKAADNALAQSSDARLRLASMYNTANEPAGALPNYDKWLETHREDSSRATAFNGRCWARALLNRELDKALSDCNAALKLRPGEANILDSRALVYLRGRALDKALIDYNAALKVQPRNAWSLYARGIVKRRSGDTAAADADRAAAIAINAGIEERAKRYGL